MAEIRWWDGRPAERYWLEATDRDDIGADLRAPDADASGRDNWRYTLFREAEVGDVVFHYDSKASAITSRSTIAGPATPKPIIWAARGSYARDRGAEPAPLAGYVIPLVDWRTLPQPLTLQRLRTAKSQLGDMLAELRSTVGPRPLYFPFELSDRPVRPMQGYAFKLPAAFVDLFDLDQVDDTSSEARAHWTDAELSAALDVYDDLLSRQASADHPNYAQVVRNLARRLGGRRPGAVVRRMQTISSMRKRQGLPTVARFGEAQTLTPGIEERLARLSAIRTPIANPDVLDDLTDQAWRMEMPAPKSSKASAPMQSMTVTRFLRRADVRGWVLRAAEGVCEGCRTPAPFVTDGGRPFLEVHHIRPLMEGGPDSICNAAALCPNCHRRLHLGSDRAAYRGEVIDAVPRLIDHPPVALRKIDDAPRS